MPGITSLLSTGQWALFASQAAIEVTGSNIANVNTPGYSRRTLRLEEGLSIDFAPGQIGTGVRATEVIRHFDAFIEQQYNEKASLRERWGTLHDSLRNVEMVFNEADGNGINAALSKFFADWQDLSLRPEDTTVRSVLLQDAMFLSDAVNTTYADLETIQGRINLTIGQEVEEINSLIGRIAELNRQITIHEIPGQNNANALRDERDLLVRNLAEKIDIKTIDTGLGNMTILTRSGLTLVDGTNPGNSFRLSFEGPKTYRDLSAGSNFDGQLYFEGSSDYEYHIEVVEAGGVGGANPARFRLSVDGGRTWISDSNGNDTFEAREYGQRILLPGGEVTVWFGGMSDPASAPATALSVGDRFSIVSKQGLYWYENTSSSLNCTPLTLSGGTPDPSRVTGGVLAGLFQLRDYFIGHYKEKLDSFSQSLAWEVNRIHSQGAGMDRVRDMLGATRVVSTTAALGDRSSGLTTGERLQSGNLTLYVYDRSTGLLVDPPRTLDMNLDPGDGVQNFNPAIHSLEDLRAALDGIQGVTASIIDNRLRISAQGGYEIAFGADTTGVLAALGINTFFQGDSASSLKVNALVASNVRLVASGHVNGAGEMNPGDNATALAMARLNGEKVSVSTSYEGRTMRTLSEFYASLVSNVGADTSMAKFNLAYHKSLADDLNARQEEVAGVNLDEEMSNLIKFQHSYQAAAKLIIAAERMLDVLLGMKQ
jgi:flagellar hook-associated protein 1